MRLKIFQKEFKTGIQISEMRSKLSLLTTIIIVNGFMIIKLFRLYWETQCI
jgi:hypothetical protein